MLSEFITKQMAKARYKLLRDGSYFGEIPGLKGVWANADTSHKCTTELQSVIAEWSKLDVNKSYSYET